MDLELKRPRVLLDWMREWEIDDKMLWKKSATSQACFVRDELCHYFLHVPCFVISWHRSKSIELPVYHFRMNNMIEATMRENFYGWVVSLKSPFPIDLPDDIIHGDYNDDGTKDIHSCYCEGFPEELVYPYYDKKVRLTTFRVNGNYRLFTLFYLLNKLGTVSNEYPFIKTKDILMNAIKQVEQYVTDMSVYELFPKSCFMVDSDFFKKHNMEYVSILRGDEDKFVDCLILDEEVQKEFWREYEHLVWGLKIK